MARQISTVALALVILALTFVACFAADVLTEGDFKKMKIKELRAFLDDRGVECSDCAEKADFVRECTKNAAKPLHPSKVKSVPKGALWEAWANVAGEVCEAAADTKGASAETKANVCSAIKTATESVFMQYGKRTAGKLRKKPDALLKTSFGEIYQAAGKKMFTKLAGFCFKNQKKCRSSSTIQALMETDNKVKGVKFISYLTNVGIENTNPMYEALKDKALDKDEL